MQIKKWIFILLLIFSTSIIAGEIYKWVDEQGRVHFSDKPVDDASQKIEIKESEESTPATEQQRKQKRDKLLKAFEEERQIKKEREAKEKQHKTKLQNKCTREKNSLKMMTRGGAFYEVDKDGNRIFLDEAEVKKRIAEMESKIEKYCN